MSDETARPAPAPSVPDPGRRRLLGAAGLGTAAAVTGLPLGADPAQALIAPPEQRAQRYQETDHVRKFYRTNAR